MIYNILYPLSHQIQLFNIFKYITFRSGAAMFTSLLLSFLLGNYIINILKKLQVNGQPIREDGPESHIVTKVGTPTMGGILILIASGISTIIWANITNIYIWIVLFVTFGFGLLGFADDYCKIRKKNSKGVSGKVKLLVQFSISVIACILVQNYAQPNMKYQLAVPFFKNILLNLSWFYILFTMVVIVGASNAVNLTDGLDGLAIVPIIIVAGCFALISYLIGNSLFANYLQIHHIIGVGELSIFCSSVIGAGLGFLWFNAPPAKVFMGDTGSLALGGAIGTISVITKHEIVLAIIGGLFVIEALSVIIQVYYFKFTKGKRFFKMAPLHHHFEKIGWSEPTIVIRFWIIAVIFALIGLSTLKLR
ncbi:MAG: phospho-N-acetylmuramoyl-pentapeptide-transferase [Alphaproteobacteria bacterium]